MWKIWTDKQIMYIIEGWHFYSINTYIYKSILHVDFVRQAILSCFERGNC